METAASAMQGLGRHPTGGVQNARRCARATSQALVSEGTSAYRGDITSELFRKVY